MDRGTRVSPGVLAQDLSETAQLVGREIAAANLDLHGRETVLALALDIRLQEAVELVQVSVGARIAHTGSWGTGLLVVVEDDPVEREVALRDPIALELLFDQLPERIDSDLVDQHLDPRPRAVDPQPLLA